MKVKNLLHLVGVRGWPKRYGYEMQEFRLDDQSVVRYAQWLHPGETKKEITSGQVNAYRTLIQPGDFAIDIGAHSGDSTLPIAIAAGKTGCVLALEPNPYLYHVLEKNARANRAIANIHTMLAAATPSQGFLTFEYSDSGFCNGGRHEGISALKHGHAFKLRVFGVNLAEELRADYSDELPRLKFLKVDAEGFDLYVIESLAQLIERYRPTLKTEVFKRTSIGYREKLLAFFHERNYTVYKIDKEPVGRGQQLTKADVNKWSHYDILAVPGR